MVVRCEQNSGWIYTGEMKGSVLAICTRSAIVFKTVVWFDQNTIFPIGHAARAPLFCFFAILFSGE